MIMNTRTGLFRHKTRVTLFFLLLVSLAGVSGAGGDEVLTLATYEGGTVTGADMDRELEYIPDDVRPRIVTETNVMEWIGERIREMAVLRELARRARLEELADFTPPLRERLARDRNRILNAALREHVWSNCTPDMEEMNRYYRRNREMFHVPGAAEFRYIFANPENGGEEAAAERVERAHALIRGGSDFEEVARLFSETGAPAEKLGKPTEIKFDEADPAIARQLQGLSPGECSSPFNSKHGFHIVQLEKLRPERYEAFEEVQDRIQYELTGQCARQKGDSIDREAAEKYPAEVHKELLEGPVTDPGAVVIRCGTFTAPLAHFTHKDKLEERMELVREAVSRFQLASYAAEMGLGQSAEVTVRIADSEAKILGEAIGEIIVGRRLSPPTPQEVEEYYDQNRQKYRALPEVSGGMMRFDAVFAVGASRKDQYGALMRAKERAQQARNRMLSGEDFAAVTADLEPPDEAREYDFAESHGALFDVHTADLEPGQVSELVGRKLSWYLFSKREEHPAREKPFDEARQEIWEDMLEDRKQMITSGIHEEVAEEIGLEINEQAVLTYLELFARMDRLPGNN